MSGAVSRENIIIHNAAENNLKNLTVMFPLNQFTCVVGASGCGKSSLVYDTLFAESQRSFLESMAGNLYGQHLMDKPKVDSIENLRPALDVSQKCYNANPRSTVGTITDISYYLRTLYALIFNQKNNMSVDMNYFSPNNPNSCCPKCKGTGEEYILSMAALIPDPEKTLEEGGITYFKGSKASLEYKLLQAICNRYVIDINKKVKNLTEEELYQLLYKKDTEEYTISFKSTTGKARRKAIRRKGAYVELAEKLEDIETPSTFTSISHFLSKEKCTLCNGLKLKTSILSFKILGVSIAEAENLSLTQLIRWIDLVNVEYSAVEYYSSILHLTEEVRKRTQQLIGLDLGYISISRSIPSLSGGELQRVRIANQLGCSLSGLVYILDEPCRGLHYNNIASIINATKELVKKGNTVVAIEHNKQYISVAQKIIELGPVGGPDGGYILKTCSGTGKSKIELKFKKSKESSQFLNLGKINYHNLQNIDVAIPLERVTAITGISGSGKSSLADVIEEVCCKGSSPYCCVESTELLPNRVMRVDQKPIGKTPRSTIVSYLGIYDEIRNIFASTGEAHNLNLSASDFSMNVMGGRCECCQGTGKKPIDLTYLPEQYITCPECKGKRFKETVLSVKYKERNIDDVLNSPIGEILSLFSDYPKIFSVLSCVKEIGLGYLSLGQMSMNLSGGEAQRIKLAKCLGAKTKSNVLYILDEPTAGLNDYDILAIDAILSKLEEREETVIIIDHNPEFIAQNADFMIDLGCVAGYAGGQKVISGLPKTVMENNESSWIRMMESNTVSIVRG